MLNTHRLLIVVGISLCAFVSTGCEPVNPTVGRIWLVNETYSPADAAVQARMNEIAPKLRFDGMAFQDTILLLRELGEGDVHHAALDDVLVALHGAEELPDRF